MLKNFTLPVYILFYYPSSTVAHDLFPSISRNHLKFRALPQTVLTGSRGRWR